MSEFWSNNNVACLNIWGHLKALHQLNKVFKETGKTKISELEFWNSLGTNDARNIQAKTLCHQFNNLFQQFDLAEFEEGYNLDGAITAMHSILTDGEKTVADFAEVVDEHYKFLGEEG